MAPKKTTALYMICVIRHSDEVCVASFKTKKDLDQGDVVDIVGEKAAKMAVGKRYSEPGDTDGQMVHFTLDAKGRVYAILTKSTYPQRLAFAALEEIQEQFRAEFGSSVKAAQPNSLSAEARPLLKSLLDKYADPAQSGDAIAKVQKKLDVATETMQDNIQLALKNTQKLEDIEEQSEALKEKSDQFRKNARALKDKYWWKNLKTKLIIGFIIVVLLIIIIVPIAVTAAPAASASSSSKNAATGLQGNAPTPAPH